MLDCLVCCPALAFFGRAFSDSVHIVSYPHVSRSKSAKQDLVGALVVGKGSAGTLADFNPDPSFKSVSVGSGIW